MADQVLMPNQTTHGHPRNGFWKNFGSTFFHSSSHSIMLWSECKAKWFITNLLFRRSLVNISRVNTYFHHCHHLSEYWKKLRIKVIKKLGKSVAKYGWKKYLSSYNVLDVLFPLRFSYLSQKLVLIGIAPA